MKTADLKTELKYLIEQESNPDVLEIVKSILTEKDYDPLIEKDMVSSAKKAEEDIKEGRVYTAQEAHDRLNKRLDL
ncbi:MAG: hypothetical protein AAFX87_00695 [Bacteroidota bacterium]